MVDLDLIGPGRTERLAYLSGFRDAEAWTAIRGVAPHLGFDADERPVRWVAQDGSVAR